MESRDEWRQRTNHESKAENWEKRKSLDPILKEKWTLYIFFYCFSKENHREQKTLKGRIKETDGFSFKDLKYVYIFLIFLIFRGKRKNSL